MRETRRLVLSLLLCLVLVAWAVPAGAETAEEPRGDEPATIVVDDAQLRWGINNEVNNRAFAPGTFNFMSAGRIGDPGQGARTLRDADGGATWDNGRRAGWTARAGNVRIEKYSESSQQYGVATWAGLRTDTEGATIPSATSRRFSGHQVVLDAGSGEIDVAQDSAEIRWSGDFTVLLYSGMSFFHVSDPVLSVQDGVGTVTATLAGYSSSMDDMTQWFPLPAETVTLARLGEVDLSAAKGVTVTPDYDGERVSTGPDQAPQVTTGSFAGAFPQSFVDFQSKVGAASYWYSSGGAADEFKKALPLSLSWSAADPVEATPPPAGPAAESVENEIVQPPAPEPPASEPTADAAAPDPGAPTSVAAAPAAPVEPVATPPADDVVPASATQPSSHPMSTLLAVSAVTLTRWPWFLGTALLLVAVAIAASTFVRRPSPT